MKTTVSSLHWKTIECIKSTNQKYCIEDIETFKSDLQKQLDKYNEEDVLWNYTFKIEDGLAKIYYNDEYIGRNYMLPKMRRETHWTLKITKSKYTFTSETWTWHWNAIKKDQLIIEENKIVWFTIDSLWDGSTITYMFK